MHWALDPNIPTSGIREILNLAIKNPRSLRLETGEPDSAPAPHILEAYVKASQNGHNRYTATEGIPRLREVLSEKLLQVNRISRAPDEILVTPGGIAALFLSFVGTTKPGEEILVPDPGWPDYLGGMASLGIRAVPYALPAPEYLPDPEAVERAVSPETRAVVLNFPGNPTGRIPPAPLVQALVDIARRHDLWIISDEVYDQIVFEGEVWSPARIAPERTLSVYSFSKTYAMTGWRLGYLSGPRDAVASLARAAMGMWSSVSEPLQYAAIAALEGPQDSIASQCQRYRARRDRAIATLTEANLVANRPQGAFYLLADIRRSGMASRQFALELLRQQDVAVAPGTAFGHLTEGWVRISLASHDDTLDQGLRRLIQFVDDQSHKRKEFK